MQNCSESKFDRILSPRTMVDQDSADVNAMVLAAKYGRWGEVYAILDRKHYLVNCIPE